MWRNFTLEGTELKERSWDGSELNQRERCGKLAQMVEGQEMGDGRRAH